MGTIQKFFAFVAMKAKFSSAILVLVGLSYALYVAGRVDIGATALFFVAVILFDMSVSAMNSRADKSGGAEPPYSRGASAAIILVPALLAIAIGLYLGLKFGPLVLAAGGACVLAGVFYSFGPAPISRSLYCGAVSGIVKGGLLPFIAYSINAPNSPLFGVAINEGLFASIEIDILAVIRSFLVFFPAMALTANITLAKNMRDAGLEKGGRYTLPMRIGVRNSAILFEAVTAAAYADIAVASLLGASSVLCLCAVPSAFVVVPNLIRFHKSKTGPEIVRLAVANFAIINFLLALFMFIGAKAL